MTALVCSRCGANARFCRCDHVGSAGTDHRPDRFDAADAQLAAYADTERGVSSVVEPLPSKQVTPVRFRYAAPIDLETLDWRQLEIDLAMAHRGLCTAAWHIINALRVQVNECYVTEGADPPYPDAPQGE